MLHFTQQPLTKAQVVHTCSYWEQDTKQEGDRWWTASPTTKERIWTITYNQGKNMNNYLQPRIEYEQLAKKGSWFKVSPDLETQHKNRKP